MRHAILVILAVAAIGIAAQPVLDAGFYADDWFIGAQMATTVHQGWFDRFVAPRWADEYQILRPLGLMWVGADLASADPARAHLASLLLWMACGLMVGAIARRITGAGARAFALGTAAFGIWPAAIEAVGWTAARPDLMYLLAALVAIWGNLEDRARPVRVSCAVLVAFACKETAVVLPLVLTWMSLWLHGPRGAPVRVRLRAALRRHAGPLGILILYCGTRWALFDSIGGHYQGAPYWNALTRNGAVIDVIGRVAVSLARLAAPVNEYVWSRDADLPLVAVQILLAAFTICALSSCVRHRPAIALALLPAVILPIVLMAIPLAGVGAGLERGRMLALPQATWALAVTDALLRWQRRKPAVGAALAGLALMSGGLLWRLDLTAYTEAATRSDRLLESLTSEALPGDRILVLNSEDPADRNRAQPLLESHLGCHLISSGLRWALRPPFRSDQGFDLVRVPHEAIADLDRFLDEAPSRGTPSVFTFEAIDDEPRFRRLAPGGSLGPPLDVQPGAGTTLDTPWDGPFRVTIPAGLVADSVRIVISEPKMYGAVARRPITGQSPAIAVPIEAFEALRHGRSTGQTLRPEVFSSLPHRQFLWWAELRHHGRLVARSAWALVRIR